MIQNFRTAFRSLLRAPGLALVAVLALGLGIGANIVISSALYTALFRPLPYPDADRLVALYETHPAEGHLRNVVGMVELRAWRDQARCLDGAAVYRQEAPILTDKEGSRSLQALSVTAGFFEVLGIRPDLGRTFTREDEQVGAGPVAILSHRLWKEMGEPAMGGSLTLDGKPCIAVGVMPPDFHFRYGDLIDIYLPREMDDSVMSPGNRSFRAVGRLKQGCSREQAQTELDQIATGLAQAYPGSYQGRGAALGTFREDQVGRDSQNVLLLLQIASALLLLIACTHVTGLLLHRALSRGRETALRAALGADAWRLAQPFLAEGACIAAGGLLAGSCLAWMGRTLLLPLLPMGDVAQHFPALRIEPTALMVGVALAFVSTFAFTLAPVMQGRKRDLERTLRQGGHGASSAPNHWRRVLSSASISLCTLLLVVTGLLLHSLWRLQRQDLGFDPRGVFSFQVRRIIPSDTTAEQKLAFQKQLLDDLRQQPGVVAAEAMAVPPLSGSTSTTGLLPAEKSGVPNSEWPESNANAITPGCLSALGMRLKAGRTFTEADGLGAPRVVLVNEACARRLWPGEMPLGRRVRIGMSTDVVSSDDLCEVVGVVQNIRLHRLEDVPEAEFYLAAAQWPNEFTMYLVRSTGTFPEILAPMIQREVRRLDGNRVVTRGRTMMQYYDRQFRARRTVLELLCIFAGVSLLLAMLGIYGTTAFHVSQTRRATGIRMAMGATPEQTFKAVIQNGLSLILPGLGAGLVMAMFVSRWISSLLYEVGPLDVLTHGIAIIFLLLASVFACLTPALHAAKSDPASALKEE